MGGLSWSVFRSEIKLCEVENAMNPPNQWACVGIFRWVSSYFSVYPIHLQSYLR